MPGNLLGKAVSVHSNLHIISLAFLKQTRAAASSSYWSDVVVRELRTEPDLQWMPDRFDFKQLLKP